MADKVVRSGLDSLDSLNGINILPTRGENRNLPLPIDRSQFPGILDPSGKSGIPTDFNFADSLSEEDFAFSNVRDKLTDYITVRINGRTDANGNPYVYRFLINPESLSISRSTVDGQTMTRAGWQFGVWGEDFVRISGKGTTAGQYFAGTLTDALADYTLSYRNLLALKVLFENNGYWFEGENKLDNGPLASNYLRRRIKQHSDVVFAADNFIWNGMFQSLTVVDSADTPYFNTFSFNFIAWKERFKDTSTWLDITRSELYRGHAYESNLSTSGTISYKPGTLKTNTVLEAVPSSLSSSNNQVSSGLNTYDMSVISGLKTNPPMLDVTKGLLK